MASICNDERASFGVMSGHGRFTLSLSGLSYAERGRASALVQLLQRAWGSETAQVFRDSLPLAGGNRRSVPSARLRPARTPIIRPLRARASFNGRT
jgi:hypothetical protein